MIHCLDIPAHKLVGKINITELSDEIAIVTWVEREIKNSLVGFSRMHQYLKAARVNLISLEFGAPETLIDLTDVNRMVHQSGTHAPSLPTLIRKSAHGGFLVFFARWNARISPAQVDADNAAAIHVQKFSNNLVPEGDAYALATQAMIRDAASFRVCTLQTGGFAIPYREKLYTQAGQVIRNRVCYVDDAALSPVGVDLAIEDAAFLSNICGCCGLGNGRMRVVTVNPDDNVPVMLDIDPLTGWVGEPIAVELPEQGTAISWRAELQPVSEGSRLLILHQSDEMQVLLYHLVHSNKGKRLGPWQEPRRVHARDCFAPHVIARPRAYFDLISEQSSGDMVVSQFDDGGRLHAAQRVKKDQSHAQMVALAGLSVGGAAVLFRPDEHTQAVQLVRLDGFEHERPIIDETAVAMAEAMHLDEPRYPSHQARAKRDREKADARVLEIASEMTRDQNQELTSQVDSGNNSQSDYSDEGRGGAIGGVGGPTDRAKMPPFGERNDESGGQKSRHAIGFDDTAEGMFTPRKEDGNYDLADAIAFGPGTGRLLSAILARDVEGVFDIAPPADAVEDTALSKQLPSVVSAQAYAPGTRIRTPRGYRRIEEIKDGEFVCGQHGEVRRVLLTHSAEYATALDLHWRPVFVSPQALGNENSIVLSPSLSVLGEFKLCEEGQSWSQVLLPVCLLVNGTTVTQPKPLKDCQKLHSLYLEAHDILNVDGMLGESMRRLSEAQRADAAAMSARSGDGSLIPLSHDYACEPIIDFLRGQQAARTGVLPNLCELRVRDHAGRVSYFNRIELAIFARRVLEYSRAVRRSRTAKVPSVPTQKLRVEKRKRAN